MPSIFKGLRLFFLQRGRFSRYLLYAIGEIILVVLGILIALQINSWNESKQNERKVQSLLKKIQKDIELDMASLVDIMPYYIGKDSIARLVLNNKLTAEDYTSSNDSKLHNLVLNLQPLNLKRGGYDNLMAIQDIIPSTYDTILDALKIQYDEKYKIVDKTHDFLIETVHKNQDYLFKNYEWYSKTIPDSLNEDAIEYFLTDVRYRGMVRKYLETSTNDHVHHAINYINTAINTYDLIDTHLGKSPNNKRPYDTSNLDRRYLGWYVLINKDTIEVLEQNKTFYVHGNRLTRLLPYKKNSFFTTNGFLRFDSESDSLYIYANLNESGQSPIGYKID